MIQTTIRHDGQLYTVTLEADGGSFRVVASVPYTPGAPAEPGVGTVIAKVTTAAGVKPCGGCKRRQAQLDKATPRYVRRLLGWAGRVPLPWSS